MIHWTLLCCRLLRVLYLPAKQCVKSLTVHSVSHFSLLKWEIPTCISSSMWTHTHIWIQWTTKFAQKCSSRSNLEKFIMWTGQYYGMALSSASLSLMTQMIRGANVSECAIVSKNNFLDWSHRLLAGPFLQRGRSACNAERCNTYSNSVCLSVRPSVTRWYPIQTNEHMITRSSLWGSKNILVFWYQQWLGATSPST